MESFILLSPAAVTTTALNMKSFAAVLVLTLAIASSSAQKETIPIAPLAKCLQPCSSDGSSGRHCQRGLDCVGGTCLGPNCCVSPSFFNAITGKCEEVHLIKPNEAVPIVDVCGGRCNPDDPSARVCSKLLTCFKGRCLGNLCCPPHQTFNKDIGTCEEKVKRNSPPLMNEPRRHRHVYAATTVIDTNHPCKGLKSQRPNLADVSDGDWNLFVSAIIKLKGSWRFKLLQKVAAESHKRLHNNAHGHGGSNFLMLNRAYLGMVETQLNSLATGARIPWYDWSAKKTLGREWTTDTAAWGSNRLGSCGVGAEGLKGTRIPQSIANGSFW